jgi:hypothetical protein
MAPEIDCILEYMSPGVGRHVCEQGRCNQSGDASLCARRDLVWEAGVWGREGLLAGVAALCSSCCIAGVYVLTCMDLRAGRCVHFFPHLPIPTAAPLRLCAHPTQAVQLADHLGDRITELTNNLQRMCAVVASSSDSSLAEIRQEISSVAAVQARRNWSGAF